MRIGGINFNFENIECINYIYIFGLSFSEVERNDFTIVSFTRFYVLRIAMVLIFSFIFFGKRAICI